MRECGTSQMLRPCAVVIFVLGFTVTNTAAKVSFLDLALASPKLRGIETDCIIVCIYDNLLDRHLRSQLNRARQGGVDMRPNQGKESFRTWCFITRAKTCRRPIWYHAGDGTDLGFFTYFALKCGRPGCEPSSSNPACRNLLSNAS